MGQASQADPKCHRNFPKANYRPYKNKRHLVCIVCRQTNCLCDIRVYLRFSLDIWNCKSYKFKHICTMYNKQKSFTNMYFKLEANSHQNILYINYCAEHISSGGRSNQIIYLRKTNEHCRNKFIMVLQQNYKSISLKK